MFLAKDTRLMVDEEDGDETVDGVVGSEEGWRKTYQSSGFYGRSHPMRVTRLAKRKLLFPKLRIEQEDPQVRGQRLWRLETNQLVKPSARGSSLPNLTPRVRVTKKLLLSHRESLCQVRRATVPSHPIASYLVQECVEVTVPFSGRSHVSSNHRLLTAITAPPPDTAYVSVDSTLKFTLGLSCRIVGGIGDTTRSVTPCVARSTSHRPSKASWTSS